MLNFLGMDADDRVYVKPFNKWGSHHLLLLLYYPIIPLTKISVSTK